MTETLHRALLPQGLRDVLPPKAEAEAALVAQLMSVLASYGYERVEPPLVEYEDNLLAGAGAAMAKETFRLMDPISQRMVGVRADMTPQVARIATTRLQNSPRPLRLSYAGQVLRVKGSQLSPERQVGQVGAELIGSEEVAADVEVLALAAEALESVGAHDLSVDLGLPTLVPAICSALNLDIETSERVRAALDHKDAASLAAVGGEVAPLLGRLLASAGAAEKALPSLTALVLPAEAASERARLITVIEQLKRRMPNLMITIDPVENRGFEYHTGVSFTFFARGVRGELGRGGRYRTGNGGDEAATGFTVYTDIVAQAIPSPAPPRRLYLPADSDLAQAEKHRAEGWVTVAGLAPVSDVTVEAKRLNCTHALEGDRIIALG